MHLLLIKIMLNKIVGTFNVGRILILLHIVTINLSTSNNALNIVFLTNPHQATMRSP